MGTRTFRLSADDQLNGQFPLRVDHRPRALAPVLSAAPPSTWQTPQASRLGPLLWTMESVRAAASLAGDDVWTLAEQPARRVPADPALRTEVRLAAWRPDPRNWMLGVAFHVGEVDPGHLPSATAPPQADPLQEDYVSVMIDLDRRGERLVEIGMTRDGRLFSRHYSSFQGNNWSEPGLAAEPPTLLGQARRAGAADQAPSREERGTVSPAALHGSIRQTDHAWIAELVLPLNRFGGYGEAGVLYPCNFVRHRPGPIPGAPAGIDWSAAPRLMTWAPVRFVPEDVAHLGFLGIGVDLDYLESQVRQLDQDLRHGAMTRRLHAVQRDLESHEHWRRHEAPSLRTQWSARALPDCSNLQRGPTLNNSRQIITLAAGTTVMLAEDADRLLLCLTDDALDPVQRSESWRTIELIGPQGLLNDSLPAGHGAVGRASMLLEPDGRLHVLFAVGTTAWHAAATPSQWHAWSVRRLPWPEHVLPYDLERCGSSVVAVGADHAGRLWLHALEADQPVRLEVSGTCPVLTSCRQGGLHLAYESQATIHYLKLDERLAPCGEPVIAAYAVCFFPAIIEADDQPIIAYQWMGVQKGSSDPAWHMVDRERGSGGIGAAWRDADGRWRHQTLMDLGETVVRRLNSRQYMLDMVSRPHRGRAFAVTDENWRPCIGCDALGVVHVGWQNTARRHALVARWTGERFSPAMELAGPLNDPTPRLGLEKQAQHGEDLKLTLVSERRLAVDAWPLRAVRLDRSDTVLFADELAAHRTRGAQWFAGRMERLRDDPVFELPGTGRGQGRDGLTQPFVVRGQHGGFVMAARSLADSSWVFAASGDGLAFEPVPQEEFLRQLDPALAAIVNHSGGEKTWGPGFNLAACRGLEDLLETDPTRRFKKIVVEGAVTNPAAVRRVHYSPDGLHWTAGPAAINNVHLNETHVPNVYDPWDRPERRFKIYGRTTTEQGRTLAMMWSGDMIHWHGEHDIVTCDGYDSRRPAPPASACGEGFVVLEGSAGLGDSEHYFCSPRLECGLYLLLYGALRGDGRKQLRLALGRDGFHFRRVSAEPLLPAGQAGAFDSGSIDSVHLLEVGDELRLYYAGTGEKHGSLPVTGQHAIGVAALPHFGWGGYRSTGRGPAMVQTVALSTDELRGRGLTCHAQGHGDDRLAVELLDAASGQVLTVHGATRSDPVRPGRGTLVTWSGRAVVWPLHEPQVRLRWLWQGPAVRLHGFALPRQEASP